MANNSPINRVSGTPFTGIVDALFPTADTQEMEHELEDVVEQWAHDLLAVATEQTIDYLASFGSGSRPPPASDPDGLPRPVHPGGWSDVTHKMVHSYIAEVTKVPGGWQGGIDNIDPDAKYIENYHGMFVVEGIELPGGPFWEALERAEKTIQIGMSIMAGMAAEAKLGEEQATAHQAEEQP